MSRWKHKKRGTTYVEVGRGFLQTTTPLGDEARVVVYRSDADGRLWVRDEAEFDDGRYEAIPEDDPAPEELIEEIKARHDEG